MANNHAYAIKLSLVSYTLQRVPIKLIPTVWGLTANQFVGEYLSGVPIETIVTELQNQTSPTANLTAAELVALIPAASADTSEDCLFLDVIVPKSTFAAKRRRASTGGE